jgi:hypothetical protein
MRRLLPLLALPMLLSVAPAAHAGCDPETGECYPTDCVAWQPQPPTVQEIKGNPKDISWLAPPNPCP